MNLGDGTVRMQQQQEEEQLTDIVKPHENDVLSGRGNFVNHHSGNENFRKLVKHHKKAYVACPKAQKAIYSKIIYDEIRAMTPPGRFLKQDPKTKLWNDIGEKKALDKTRQALREGAPELLKELEGGDGSGSVEQDSLAPLRAQQNMLRESIMGNISVGSFSLGSSFNLGASFSTPHALGASFNTSGPISSFTIPQHVGVNNAHLFDSQGTQSLLVAAAQLQAQQDAQQHLQAQLEAQQQQQHLPQPQNVSSAADLEDQVNALKQQTETMLQQNLQQPQNVSSSAELESQLIGLKQQMQTLQENKVVQQDGGVPNGSMGSDQTSGFNAVPAAPQAPSSSAAMGSNPETEALLAAIHNNASGLNNAPGMGGNDANIQQQLARLMMLNGQMGNSEATLQTGNLASEMNQLRQSANSMTGGNNSMSSMGALGSNAANGSGQMTSFGAIAEQQPQLSSFPQQFEDTSIPLKDTSSPGMGVNNRRPARSGGPGLTSSFTRAQRIGLRNSMTRRPNRHMTNSDLHHSLKNSLMSIESLTLDDIDSGTESFGTNVFEEVQRKGSGGQEKNGQGPHDMSEISRMSEVSEWDVQGKA